VVESSTLQKAARLVAIVFLLVGILGFVPGITEDAPGDFMGEDSPASLLHVFQTSILHNLVHLAFGVAGLALSRTWEGSRNFLIGGGAIYLLLFLVGLLSALDWLPADDTDDWLHLALGAGMVALGLLLRGRQPNRDRYAGAEA
jgi:Domain of unknown function (DUF4383)